MFSKCKVFIYFMLLFTTSTARVLANPSASEEEAIISDLFTLCSKIPFCNNIINLIHEFETGEVRYKYTPAEVEQNMHLLINLARIGASVLPSEAAEGLEEDIAELLEGLKENKAIMSSLKAEDKRDKLEEMLRSVSHLADKEYQRQIWVCTEDHENEIFDDEMYTLFDTGELITWNYTDFGIARAQQHLLMRLLDELDAFTDDNDCVEDFIDTPEWEKIMDKAKEVLTDFNYQENFQ